LVPAKRSVAATVSMFGATAAEINFGVMVRTMFGRSAATGFAAAFDAAFTADCVLLLPGIGAVGEAGAAGFAPDLSFSTRRISPCGNAAISRLALNRRGVAALVLAVALAAVSRGGAVLIGQWWIGVGALVVWLCPFVSLAGGA